MADILIRGMEMPKDCYTCSFRTTVGLDEWMCMASKNRFMAWEAGWNGDTYRHKNCPLVELPEHGDLVDRDEYIAMMESNCDKSTTLDSYIFHVCRGGVKTMPVIVPSNKEEEIK